MSDRIRAGEFGGVYFELYLTGSGLFHFSCVSFRQLCSFTALWEKADLVGTNGCMWKLSIDYTFIFFRQTILPESKYGKEDIASLKR